MKLRAKKFSKTPKFLEKSLFLSNDASKQGDTDDEESWWREERKKEKVSVWRGLW